MLSLKHASLVFLATCSLALHSTSAHAGLILGEIDALAENESLLDDIDAGATTGQYVGWSLACVLVLPICLLDQRTTDQPVVSEGYLKDNGYSAREIQAIRKDQKEVAASLAKKNLRLQVGTAESHQQIEEELRSVDPSVSGTYIDFVYENVPRR